MLFVAVLVGTPLGALAGETPEPGASTPIVFLHGFASNPDIWRGAERSLAEGPLSPVLVAWEPSAGQDAQSAATDSLLPAIEAALAERGHPPGASFHVAAHSMSGLLVRYLLEQARPELGDRVESLVMLSTPNHGARTGVAGFACRHWAQPDWRRLACALTPDSELVQLLGRSPPPELPTRYLAIGVESFEPFVPIPHYDGDGDGRPAGHDKAVMAESAFLQGVPFVVWRAWGRRGDHFGSTCSLELIHWIEAFAAHEVVPTPPPGRVRASDACVGLSKRQWRQAQSR